MIAVSIIEDNKNYRETLTGMLEQHPDIECIHRLNDCEEMIGRFETEKPDVVLLDIDLPGRMESRL